MRDAGRFVEERHGHRLHECFIDATFSKARGVGDGISCPRTGRGVEIMVLVDARELSEAIDTTSAKTHEGCSVQSLFDFTFTNELLERVIIDKAYDSDELDAGTAERGIEVIASHRSSRKNYTQDGRSLRRYSCRWTVERTTVWIQHFCHVCRRRQSSLRLFQGFLQLGSTILLRKQALGQLLN